MPLFDPTFVYPSDGYGSYLELEGEVILIGGTHLSNNDLPIVVRTALGDFTGYIRYDHAPEVGYTAIIRVYDAGGGHYPDNRITSWRGLEAPTPVQPESRMSRYERPWVI